MSCGGSNRNPDRDGVIVTAPAPANRGRSRARFRPWPLGDSRAGQLQSHARQRTQVAARNGHGQRLIRSSRARQCRCGYNEGAR